MLKLEQINIVEENVVIAEILEPIVYTHIGSVVKTDDIISREKERVPYLLAKIVKVGPTTQYIAADKTDSKVKKEVVYKVDDIIMIPRSAMNPITFPIEGYDTPKLANIATWSIFAKIEEEVLDTSHKLE